MNDKQISLFFQLVETSSFTKAADIVFLSRQALKKQIDNLEEELGFRLFLRSPKGIQLTPEGEKFYQGARTYNDNMQNLLSECRAMGPRDNLIRIINPYQPRFLLQDSIARFISRFPEVSVDVTLKERSNTAPQGVVRQIHDGIFDIAECVKSEITNISELSYLKLANLTYNCVMVSSHPLAAQESIDIEDLSGSIIGIRASGNAAVINQINSRCHDVRFSKNTSSELKQIMSVCYQRGIFISRSYFSTYVEGFVSRPLNTDIVAECGIIFSKNHSPAIEKFINIVKEDFPASS